MQNVLNELKNLRGSILILTHHNADIDAISSAIALYLGLKQLNLETKIGVAESVSKPAQKLSENFEILINPDCKKFDNVILLETSAPEQLTSIKNLRVDIIIDHHPEGKLVKQAKTSWIDEKEKSTAQMIYKLLKKLNCKINKEMAEIIIAGIVADTAHLRLADLEVFEILIELLKTGVEYKDVLKLIETPSDESESIACLKAAKRMDVYKIGNLIIVISNVSSHEAAASRALLKIGADVAIVIAVKEKEVRISSRAKEKILDYKIDLSEIFKEIGNLIDGSGGGHNLAGSANGKNKKAIQNVIKYILKEISKKVENEIKKIE